MNVTRAMLAAMGDNELDAFWWENGTDLLTKEHAEAHALVTCEMLRRSGYLDEPGLRSTVRIWNDIPPTVPELRELVEAARRFLERGSALLQ
jgi:hypothetical protein